MSEPSRKPAPGKRAILVVASASLIILCAVGRIGAQENGALVGRVVDDESGAPVPNVVVRIREVELSALTGADGGFEFASVASGPQILRLDHVAYGEHLRVVVVTPGSEARVTIRLARQPITLAPIVVEGRTAIEFRRVSSGNSMNEIEREEIDHAARMGLNLGQLIEQGIASARVRPGASGPHSCVEYRGSALGGACRGVAVVLDGVPITAPETLFSSMPLGDIERLEILSPGQAGLHHGIDGGWGVLLVETRRGIRTDRPGRVGESLLAGFDQALETRSYRWARVAASSMAGNMLGLGLSLVAADQCFEMRERGIVGVRRRCNSVTTALAGFLTLGLPAVGGSYAATWAGATERSKGRFVPGIVAGTISVASGYLLVVHGEAYGSRETVVAGTTLLLIGTPTLITLTDRILRVLR